MRAVIVSGGKLEDIDLINRCMSKGSKLIACDLSLIHISSGQSRYLVGCMQGSAKALMK